LTIGLADKNHDSKLIIQNASGAATLAINSVGDLISSGSGTFQKLNIGFISPAFAISDTQVSATGSAGITSIKPYKTEMTIQDSLVTDKSLIYITPRANTGNNVLYLLRQTPEDRSNPGTGSFTVGINQAQKTEIQFNWIIIN